MVHNIRVQSDNVLLRQLSLCYDPLFNNVYLFNIKNNGVVNHFNTINLASNSSSIKISNDSESDSNREMLLTVVWVLVGILICVLCICVIYGNIDA